MTKGYMAKLEAKNWNNKRHWDFCKRVMVTPKNGLFYNSSTNIGRIYYKEKSSFPRFKWIEDPYNLFRWVFKINDMMPWWHDAMQEMAWWMHKQNKSHDKTRNSWKYSGASVSGRYNTPPLQEDLVPRSRMAPERNGRGREEVKLSCFFDKRVKPMNLEKLNNWKERIQWRWTKLKTLC